MGQFSEEIIPTYALNSDSMTREAQGNVWFQCVQ